MIQFEKFQLDNGLKVLVHQDTSTPMAVVNVLYNVGAKDEDPAKTGFAHLFEHLMFGGSVNIPVYDEPLQRAGGENNAYTTNDLTNYYCQIPAENIETAFWLESDRMLSLAFSKKSLEDIIKRYIDPYRPTDTKEKTEKEIARSEAEKQNLEQEIISLRDKQNVQDIIQQTVSIPEAQTKIKQFLNS